MARPMHRQRQRLKGGSTSSMDSSYSSVTGPTPVMKKNKKKKRGSSSSSSFEYSLEDVVGQRNRGANDQVTLNVGGAVSKALSKLDGQELRVFADSQTQRDMFVGFTVNRRLYKVDGSKHGSVFFTEDTHFPKCCCCISGNRAFSLHFFDENGNELVEATQPITTCFHTCPCVTTNLLVKDSTTGELIGEIDEYVECSTGAYAIKDANGEELLRIVQGPCHRFPCTGANRYAVVDPHSNEPVCYFFSNRDVCNDCSFQNPIYNVNFVEPQPPKLQWMILSAAYLMHVLDFEQKYACGDDCTCNDTCDCDLFFYWWWWSSPGGFGDCWCCSGCDCCTMPNCDVGEICDGGCGCDNCCHCEVGSCGDCLACHGSWGPCDPCRQVLEGCGECCSEIPSMPSM